MEKVSILIYPNSDKKSKRTNLIPLYIRVRIKKQKTESNLQIYLNEGEFSQWNPLLMKIELRDSAINRMLSKLESKIEEVKIRYYPNLHKLTPFEIKDQILGKGSDDIQAKEIPLIGYINAFYNEKIVPNGSITVGTKKNYNKSINHLKNYIKLNNLDRMPIHGFTKKNALDFKDYLLMDIVATKKTKLRQTSANGIVVKLKVIMKRALEEDLIVKNPFTGLSFTLEYEQKYRLNTDEISRIAKADLDNYPNLKVYRDVFLFSICTGLSYTDAFNLKRNALVYLNGDVMLTINRSKTKEPVKQFLIPFALQLVEKYNDDPQAEPLQAVFPPRSLDKYNFYLKQIASLCSIHHNITTHVARHTCMQNLAEAGVEDMQVRNLIMGWSSKSLMSSNYYHVSESRLLEAKLKLEKYLKNSLYAHEKNKN